jgi:hypothetical protein
MLAAALILPTAAHSPLSNKFQSEENQEREDPRNTGNEKKAIMAA